MRVHFPGRWAARLLLAAAAALTVAEAAQAYLFIFKDGFVIRGRPPGQPFRKPGGMRDGPVWRNPPSRIAFSPPVPVRIASRTGVRQRPVAGARPWCPQHTSRAAWLIPRCGCCCGLQG